KTSLPPVDLTDVVLYRKATVHAESIPATSESIALTPGTPLVGGARVPAAIAETRPAGGLAGRRFAALAPLGVAAAICCAVRATRTSRQPGENPVVEQTSVSPPPKASAGTRPLDVASTTPREAIPPVKSPAEIIAQLPHHTLTDDSVPGAWEQTQANSHP